MPTTVKPMFSLVVHWEIAVERVRLYLHFEFATLILTVLHSHQNRLPIQFPHLMPLTTVPTANKEADYSSHELKIRRIVLLSVSTLLLHRNSCTEFACTGAKGRPGNSLRVRRQQSGGRNR